MYDASVARSRQLVRKLLSIVIVETPTRTRAELHPWPAGQRQACSECGGTVHRARDLDGAAICFCDGDCRNEFGYPVFPTAHRRHTGRARLSRGLTPHRIRRGPLGFGAAPREAVKAEDGGAEAWDGASQGDAA